MAISSRGEGGVGGGSRGMSGGGGLSRMVKKVVKPKKKAAKPLAEPKSNVKVIPAMPKGLRKATNDYATMQSMRIKSGAAAKSADSARAQAIQAAKKQAVAQKPKLAKRAVQKSEMYGVRVLKNK